MTTDDTERLLRRYAASLSDEEVWEQVRPEVRAKISQFAERQGGRSSRVFRTSVAIGVPLAIAACLAIILLPRVWIGGAALEVPHVLAFEVAGSQAELFSRNIALAPIDNRFWLGVQVDRPCWIYLLERTQSGELIVIRLSRDRSSDEFGLRTEMQQRIGSFSVMESNAKGGLSQVTHVVVIAALDPIDTRRLEHDVPDQLAPGGEPDDVDKALATLANTLEEQFRWRVRYRRIETTPP